MKRFASKTIIILVALFINSAILTGNVKAQYGNSVSSIPEDDRPGPAGPWFVGSILSAGAIVVGLKNSKRTHLD